MRHLGMKAAYASFIGQGVQDQVEICEGYCFVPPVPTNLQELRECITTAMVLIDCDMLTRVWNEFDYRLDVCHISKGGHIEHL